MDATISYDTVVGLLANPPSQQSVAANAERFSWSKNAAALSEIYKKAAAKP